jgi:hypothetical protein
MTDPINRPPLWQKMRQAEGSLASDYQSPEARALRAIAEAISNELATHIVGDDPVMEVVAWLLAEADKAEAGA